MSSIIGISLPRLGAIERVTGAQQYAADIRLDNALHVKLVSLAVRARADRRGPYATKPRAFPVCAASSPPRDLPQPVPRYGPVHADRPMLASGETKFSGEPVAVVVADTEDAADTRRARSFASISRSCRRCCRSTRRSTPRLRSCRTPSSAPQRSARAHQHAAAMAVRLGRRRRRRCRSRHRERLRVSDGHALRHRAARVSRRARRERRHDLEPDAASVRAAARRRRRAPMADRESADHRARSRRRLRRQRAGRRSSR